MEDNKNIKMPPKRRMGPPGRGMAPVEKAKDFKGSIGKLIRYIGSYKIAIIFVAVMAVCSTVFSVVGPKVLGKATTALSEGLVKKIGEMLNIITRTPIIVVKEVMIVVILWLSPIPSVSTSLVILDNTSPYVLLSKYFIGIR